MALAVALLGAAGPARGADSEPPRPTCVTLERSDAAPVRASEVSSVAWGRVEAGTKVLSGDVARDAGLLEALRRHAERPPPSPRIARDWDVQVQYTEGRPPPVMIRWDKDERGSSALLRTTRSLTAEVTVTDARTGRPWGRIVAIHARSALERVPSIPADLPGSLRLLAETTDVVRWDLTLLDVNGSRQSPIVDPYLSWYSTGEGQRALAERPARLRAEEEALWRELLDAVAAELSTRRSEDEVTPEPAPPRPSDATGSE